MVGASGDLARKKIIPALFALFYQGMLPQDFAVMGFARSKMTDDEFRELICENLTCRVDLKCARPLPCAAPGSRAHAAARRDSCAPAQEEFLSRCFYCSGLYDQGSSYEHLSESISKREKAAGHARSNRIFYLSIPPSIFVSVAQNAAKFASSTSASPPPVAKSAQVSARSRARPLQAATRA